MYLQRRSGSPASLPSEVHLHLGLPVFDRVTADVEQRLFHRAGKRKGCAVVLLQHDRRARVATDADASSEAKLEWDRHRQIALAHRLAIDEEPDMRRHSFAMGNICLACWGELEAEYVIAFR